MRKAKVFILAFLLMTLSNVSLSFATPRDVQLHWASTEINTLIENNIIKGYPDGRFRPSRYVTKEEACLLIVSLAKSQGLIADEELYVDANMSLLDVKNSWSSKEIHYLYRVGIVDVGANGLFNPSEKITREMLADIIYRYYKHFNLFNSNKIDEMLTESAITEAVYNEKICPFTDIDDSYAAIPISEMYKAGVLNGYSNNTYCPENKVTRAEMAKILYKMSGLQPIYPTVTLPAYRVIDVPYISQLYPISAVVGCEATSLLMGLHSKGYAMNVDLCSFLDAMPKHTSNPAKGFVGSPYMVDKTKKTRTTIYPAVLATWASSYGNVSDFSGSSIQEIRAELLDGNPVVIYATMSWEEPFYRMYNIEGQMQRLLSNNHVVLACGYDMNTNKYYIADPYNINNVKEEYRYWIDGCTFERIYNERQHAVVVE